MDLGLKAKTVLITGSHRGTGFIIAEQFAKEGAKVIIHGFDQESSDEAARQIPGSIAVHGDICTDVGSRELVDSMTAQALKPDILVNNYGAADAGSWQSLETEDWIESYQKNTLSVMRMVQAFSPYMKAQKAGRIINLGTIGSTRPNSLMPHYYAAKGALANMTVSLAKSLSGTGISVNLVSPGLIRTPEVEASFMKKARQKGWGNTWQEAETQITERYAPNPMGRIATREEVAQIVVFLAGQNASFVNGQNIRVDGGALDIV